ncbi:hypothetical protein BKA93DRAFT_737469 [Sparassis latifolia]|uniref:Uncharacterized protein n=1 Tax=Sparassis crispa TaxID=139825 RepID=A0A401G823_9APHY|nr:hypothetical protein SCP_0112060 [Sparassis crispa]GBE78321.1 hypothetical protein SCP_0112060 [Sparassis crispa]
MTLEPPPTYSQQVPGLDGPPDDGTRAIEAQILIVPTANAISFQTGYLGAEGERAAIEGELQLKCADNFEWDKVTMSLRTVESAYGADIELANTEVVLFPGSREHASRSSFPFSIPLPPDTPQCIHATYSSVTHTLSAVVSLGDSPILSRSLTVHTRQYTAHPYTLDSAPETRVLEDPTRIEVQVPRTTFTVGEPIPIYITVPAPDRELVVEQGLRLRNIRAELVRLIKVDRSDGQDDDIEISSDYDFELLSVPASDEADDAGPSPSLPAQKGSDPSSSGEGVDFRTFTGVHGEKKVVALSGASCRLHPTRPIRIRLVLHRPSDSPIALSSENLPAADQYTADTALDCASISQTTILHRVSFMLRARVTFMNMANHTERVSIVSIPIIMLPPAAPLPEVEQSMDAAYHKKHDRPPARTVRMEDTDAPHYDDTEAGPSFLGGAPPPFEEREAPPPFSSAGPEASTSSRLPTFLESETDIYVPSSEDPSIAPPPPHIPELEIEGEGTLFGFAVSEQFDGYAEDLNRSYTPPPTLEMASRDANVTGLAHYDDGVTIQALGLALEQHDDATGSQFPPPPPPMDDPSDPPPCIDSAFRSPGDTRQGPPPHPLTQPLVLTTSRVTDDAAHSSPSDAQTESHGHAPPPYRTPDNGVDHEHEHVVRPPPYVDLIPHPHHA